MHKGNLYIVATPIGNLQDITLRAIDVLKRVNYIACEDTRKTGILLKNLNLKNEQMLISFYDQVEEEKIPNIVNILKNGEDVALVSDSGTPTISDPGFKLVRKALGEGINVIPIPGPNAAVAALSSSGLPTDKFLFLGFLPKKEGNRTRLLEDLRNSNKNLESTVIIYEAPHRLMKSLMSILSVFGDIEVVLMRELTKIHEQVFKLKITEALTYFENKKPKGEYVILFNTKPV